MKTRPYADHEWETLSHIVMTDDKDWDPTVLPLWTKGGMILYKKKMMPMVIGLIRPF